MFTPDTPVENVPRINSRILPSLRRLGIRTIRDLLFHFPARYEDFSNIKNIADITAGEVVTISGEIKKVSLHRTARKHMAITEAEIEDDSGKIKALWFNQPFMARNLREGARVRLSGKISLGPKGIYLQNPAHEILRSPASTGKSDFNGHLHTGGLVAIYPETRGITSRWLRFLIKNFIPLSSGLTDPLPEDMRKKYSLPELARALKNIHFPESMVDVKISRRRFSFEELLMLQLRSLRARANLKNQRAPEIALDIELIKKFTLSLPFLLTDAQRRSIWEIVNDLKKPNPMNRLLEGDVGSGKTVVAAVAALLAARAGYRAAFMAPTEILAHQHYATLQKILGPLGVKVGIMTGAKKTGAKSELVVGTHALLQKNAGLENLGLVIIDEQHRFGVSQRALLVRSKSAPGLRESAFMPHLLSMTATPIPRTLALTIYGDLDLSVLDEMPKFRKSVTTKIVDAGRRGAVYAFIRDEVKKGRQVFVICPRIEIPADTAKTPNLRSYQQKLKLAEVKSVKEEYEKLSKHIFPDLRVAMLHGKLKSKEKEAVMKKFAAGSADILVSTSVIEVGVDIPNATIMMIEGAERFGLAQLHQFRGRVGRGVTQSYCFLFTTEDSGATQRLRAIEKAKSGFELAEYDLKIRGPGDMFGTEQWGISRATLEAIADPDLVRKVREAAHDLAHKDPALSGAPEMRRRLKEMEDAHPE